MAESDVVENRHAIWLRALFVCAAVAGLLWFAWRSPTEVSKVINRGSNMPYIKQDRRVAVMAHGAKPENAGELNFLLTRTALEQGPDHPGLTDQLRTIAETYVNDRSTGGTLRYQMINDAMGAFAGASLEMQRRKHTDVFNRAYEQAASDFYMRVAAPYEDLKSAENGDVYT